MTSKNFLFIFEIIYRTCLSCSILWIIGIAYLDVIMLELTMVKKKTEEVFQSEIENSPLKYQRYSCNLWHNLYPKVDIHV